MFDKSARIASGRRQVSRGFTLFELIITMAIVAILVAVALPSFQEFFYRMTVSDNSSDLISAMNVARAEAVKRGRSVAVIVNDGDWNSGWQVVVTKEVAGGLAATPVSPGPTEADCTSYIDNGVNAANTTQLCPRWHGALPTGYTIFGLGTGAGASSTQVTFSPTGTLTPATVNRVDFNVCRPADHPSATKSRWVTVTAMGVITSRRDVTSSPVGACP